MSQTRILLGHSYWGRGGAEFAATWVLQALCRHHRVDLVSRGGWDLDELNRFSGTNIQREDLGAILYPPLVPRVNRSGGALWHGCFVRYCRSIAPRYDLCITASQTFDWGRPALHFLSDVAWNRPLQERFQCPEVMSHPGVLRRAYCALGRWVGGDSDRDAAQHDTLVANSQWTARISSDFCRIPPVVIHPAIPEGPQPTGWAGREDSFLCLGRVSPEKQIERVVAILDQVHALGHPVRLHVAGNGDDPCYVQQMQRLCDARRDWTTFHGPLYGPAKLALFGRCRFGISACDREAFGIATAEMIKAGIVPFVPQEGAQAEIVQQDALIYQDIEDAALKIDAVLKSPTRQQELHQAMLRQGAAFQPEYFCDAVRDLVKRVLDTRPAVRGC